MAILNSNIVPVCKMKPIIKQVLNINIVPYIAGSPGIGKSAIVRDICEELEYMMIDFRASTAGPCDMAGLPNFKKDSRGNLKSSFIELDVWPLAKDFQSEDDLPINPKTNKPYKGFIVFLDELSSANKSMQVAMYKVILDRKINEDDLYKNTYIIAAGNREQDGAVVVRMSSAMRNRMAMLEMSCEGSEDNIKYFIKNVFKNYHPLVKNTILSDHSLLNNFNPNSTQSNYATPRSWQRLSEYFTFIDNNNSNSENKKVEIEEAIVSSIIGEDAGSKLFVLLELLKGDKLPTIDQIADDPLGVAITNDKKYKFATAIKIEEYLNNNLTTRLSVSTDKAIIKKIEYNVSGLAKFLANRMSIDIAYSCITKLALYTGIDGVEEVVAQLGSYYE